MTMKKKSSGWLSTSKRGTPLEQHARGLAATEARARRRCDRQRFWRDCPVRRCKRVRGCTGDPLRCLDRPRPTAASAQRAPAAGSAPPGRPVLSAAEAAAAIAASIADIDEPSLLPGEEFEPIVRDGRVQYLPRRRPR